MKKRSIPDVGKADWTATGSFMNKPKHGWYHSNEDITRGVTYKALYVGCVKILQSVKSLSIDQRSAAIQEATARCCDKAGFVKYKKKNIPQSLSNAFGDVFTGYRGESILITISKSNIKIVLERTGVLICDHFIENISFASGGEKKYSSFVSYIAKDNVFERACFVIECEKESKSEVIQSIGQAFEAKYKDFVNKPLVATEIPERFSQPIFPAEDIAASSQPGYGSLHRDVEMKANGYSKLHEKDSFDANTYSKLDRQGTAASYDSSASGEYSQLQHGAVAQGFDSRYDRIRAGTKFTQKRPSNIPVVAGAEYDKIQQPGNFAAVYDNPMASPTTRDAMLIDFNDNSPEYQTVQEGRDPTYDNPKDLLAQIKSSPYDNPKDLMKKHDYQQPFNNAQGGGQWEQFNDTPNRPAQIMDSDREGYLVPTGVPHESVKYASLHHDSEDSAEYQSPEEIADYQRPKSSDYQPPDTHYQTPRNADRPKSCVGPINNQPWFHGNISRIDAEMLIESDGQFLVRESSSSKGQYVLSGMKGSQHCHLLLVDPEGQVRTKDRMFATVEELVLYHQNNNLPIISGGSEVHILKPILRNSQGSNNTKINHGNSFKI